MPDLVGVYVHICTHVNTYVSFCEFAEEGTKLLASLSEPAGSKPQLQCDTVV